MCSPRAVRGEWVIVLSIVPIFSPDRAISSKTLTVELRILPYMAGRQDEGLSWIERKWGVVKP